MGSENFGPLEELKALANQVDQIETLSGLQPLFARLEEITKQYSGDFEVQVVAHDVREQVLKRGSWIKKQPPIPIAAPPPPPSTPPPPPKPEIPVPPVPPPTLEPTPKRGRIAVAWVLVLLAAIAGLAVAYSVIRDRNARIAATTTVDVNLTTEPAGASIQVNGQQTCISDCVAKLLPGSYEVIASLEGYETATGQVVVSADKPAGLMLALKSTSPRIRVSAEMASGQVFLDDQQVGELQDGQFVIEQPALGAHTLRVTGGNSEAVVPFELSAGAMPVITGRIQTKNLLAVALPHNGAQARVATSAAPAKLTFNGQVQPDVPEGGVDVGNFQPGPAEIVIGEGKTQKNISDTFTAAPELAVYLKTDQDIGTLLITTNEDDVRVFVNNRENRRRTEKGQLRVQTFGKVTVRVQKPGFEELPPQTATVTKGAEVKLNFALKELPKFGTLMIMGGTPGAEVLIDQRSVGTIGTDGGYRNSNVAPGDHVIDVRRDQFEPKRLTRSFRAGQTTSLIAGEATLAAVKPPPPPPPPPPKPEPTPVKPPPPKPRTGDMLSFDTPGLWRQEGDIWKHRGAAALTYGIPPNGVFTFSIYMLKGGNILRGGRVRWFLNYTDSKNYALFELDEENFWTKVVENGKTLERKRVAHKQDKSMRVWNIQIDVNPSRVIHKIQGDNGWVELDTWAEPGRDWTRGKFGILVTGSDEVGLSNFQFTGR